MAETRAELDEDIEELFCLARELGVEEGDGFFSDNERIEHRSALTAVQPPSTVQPPVPSTSSGSRYVDFSEAD